MNQNQALSLILLDNRKNEILNEYYGIPIIENEKIKEKIEKVIEGNVVEIMKEYKIEMKDINEIPTSNEIGDIDKLMIGITLLNGFVRMNFIGPFDLPIDETSKKDVEYLTIDAEKVNKHTVNSKWLHICAKIFGMLKEKEIPYLNLFIGRQALVHQRMLENPSDSLLQRIGCGYRDGMKE